MTKINQSLALLILSSGLISSLCWAGRPIGTDDASTADKGTCQLESWHERAKDSRAFVIAPACGVVDGVELGMDFTKPSSADAIKQAAGIALKWGPSSWRIESAGNELQFGLKLSSAYEYPRAAKWKQINTVAQALATLKIGPLLTLHTNIGHLRDHTTQNRATLVNLAMVSTPTDALLLFAETQTNDRRPILGGAINTLGGRLWLIKDRLGLDLTASRIAGIAGSTNSTT